jgi:hypothetical protein
VLVESSIIPEGNILDTIDSALCVFNTHAEADSAIRSLSKSGFDVKKLSLVGKGYHSEERPIGLAEETASARSILTGSKALETALA